MALELEIDHTISKDASGAISRASKKRTMDAMAKGFAVSLEHVPEDRGTLRQSGFSPTQRDDGSIVFGYRAGHAAPMEYGTDPFYPPVQPLLEWSKRVTGDTGLGWYVAKHKIPEEGIDAQPYMSPAADAVKEWLDSNSFGDYLEDELE